MIVGQQLAGYSCVFHDDYHAFYDVTKLLLKKGRHKLGYISAIMQDEAVGAERYRGVRDAVSDMGFSELSENFVTASFTVASGYEKTRELFDKCRDLDGVVCATDTMAACAMQYLFEQGIAVPEQVIVAGQGDSEMSKVTAPPLITVHYSYEKSGEVAVQMLMDVLEKKEAAFQQVKLGYYIVGLEEN